MLLPDLQVKHTYSEEWRLECEARMLAKKPQFLREKYIMGTPDTKGVLQIPGESAAADLVASLMKMGAWSPQQENLFR